jgi:pyridoxine 5-phosphate synthase
MKGGGMAKLGVNIDHVATLRQVRGTVYPSLLDAAACCEVAGAAGITVHLREDRRHIQDADVYVLRKALRIPLNLEMAVSEEIVAIALEVLPQEVCLVPEKRKELTTEGGLDAAGSLFSLGPVVKRLQDAGIVVSLFLDPEERQLDAAIAVGVPVVELHTGSFCDAPADAARHELVRLQHAAAYALQLGLQVNAGHGIHMGNIDAIMQIPGLHTLNIGHSIVARAVFCGLEAAVREMRLAIEKGGTCDVR